MRQVDPELQRLYKLVLKEGYRITELFYWKEAKGYTISLVQPDHDDPNSVYYGEHWEDVFLKEIE